MYRAFLPFLLLIGCNKSDINGIWALEIPVLSFDDVDACTEEVTHNFEDATLAEEEEDIGGDTGIVIEEELSASESPMLAMVSVQEGAEGTATLIWEGNAWPGTEKDGGGWTFSWEGTTDSTLTRSAGSDYDYSEATSTTTKSTFSLTFEDDTVRGTLDASTVSDANYTESDEWSPETADAVGNNGNIPASFYLEVTIEQGGATITAPASNTSDRPECGGDCSLGVKTTCAGSVELSGSRTGYSTEDVPDAVMGAGQAAGAGGL